MKPSDEFYDNPGAYLSIGYSWTEVRLSPMAEQAMHEAEPPELVLCKQCKANRRTCGCLSPQEQGLDDERISQLREQGITDTQYVIPSNSGAHKEFELKARAIFESGEAQSLAEAQRIAREELPDLVHPQSQEEEREADYLGDSIESLMAHKSGGKGGGGSSGRSRAKTFPKRCAVPDCHLQYCEHEKGPGKGGRPWDYDEPKSETLGGMRLTPTAAAGLQKYNVTPSDVVHFAGSALEHGDIELLGVLGEAIIQGKKYEEVRLNNPPITIPKDAA